MQVVLLLDRSTTLSSFRAIFPYEHNYAATVHKEFVSIVKWLKMIHHRQKPAFTSNSPLPADMVIKVRVICFLFPIEVFRSVSVPVFL